MDFHFTTDWFSHNIPHWERHLSYLAGQRIHVLEIGSWEGRSAVWLLQNIVTNPQSSMTCVDTFKGSAEHSEDQVESLYERFIHNIQVVASPATVIIHDCSAQEFFSKKEQRSYDLIYIDGSHYSWDVLTEAIHCWPLLNQEGILIFDDYLWEVIGEFHEQPKIAIDAFLEIFQDKVIILEKGYQVMVQKKTA